MEKHNGRIRLLALLAAQCLAATSAGAADVIIPAAQYDLRWGTVVIPEQSIEDVRPTDYVYFFVTNVPKGFELTNLKMNGSKYIHSFQPDNNNGSITYETYTQIKSLELDARPLPITSPEDLANVVNGFVPNGARVNGEGEVELLGKIKPDYNNYSQAYREPWKITADITAKGSGGDCDDDGYRGVCGFDIEIEDSYIVSENAFGHNYLKITNSTIAFKGPDTFTIESINISTKGDVTFKGVYDDDDERRDDDCPNGNKTVGFIFDDVADSNITFESLFVLPSDFTIGQSTSISFKDCFYAASSASDIMTINGGKAEVQDCQWGYTSDTSHPYLLVESGSLQVSRSRVSSVTANGKDAEIEINSGFFEALTVNDGKVTVNNGHFPNGITVTGGSLEMNGGTAAILAVNDAKCDIELSNCLLGGIKIPSEVNKSIWSMLGDNAGYYDRDNTYMPFRLEEIEGRDETEGSIITATTYPVSFVFSNFSSAPTPAYTAALGADVGPHGTDIKVRANGDLEILTPEGMAWLAFSACDTHGRVKTGREYFDNGKDWYLMADLDMAGYGNLWPKFSISGRTFYGQRHRIYNLDIIRPDASFINTIGENAVVRDLIVEGSSNNMKDEGGRMPDNRSNRIHYDVAGFALTNQGLIVNCAYKGGVWNSALGGVDWAGFVRYNKGWIENCYAAPCNEIVGGARYAGDTMANAYVCGPGEFYRGAGFTYQNNGHINNGYFGGKASYGTDLPDEDGIWIRFSPDVNMNNNEISGLYYLDSDISAETLNANATGHTPEKHDGDKHPYVEWAGWAANEAKQCGRPYFVWETELNDTPSGITDAANAQDDLSVWAADGTLYVKSGGDANICIYSANGVLRGRYTAKEGTIRVALPKGTYIVTNGKSNRKITF